MGKIDIRSVVIGVLLAIVVMTSIGSLKSTSVTGDRVKARVFQVVDANGNVCGTFGANDTGDWCGLSMGVPPDKNTFSAYVTQADKPQGGNVVLKIQGTRGELRITSGPYGDAGPVVYMSNHQGKGVMDLGVAGEPGDPFIRLNLRDPNRTGVPAYQMLQGRPVTVFDDQGLLWASPARSQGGN